MNRFSKHKTPLVCAACLAYSALLLSHPAVGAAALRDGLFLCAERLVTSLLPFLFIAGFMLRSGAAASLGKVLTPLSRRIFHLPGICAPVILMALTGGYPVGLNLIAVLAHTGQISAADARRMTRFCLGAGPAFVVLGIGQSLFGSSRAGWLLFAALITSALVIGLILPHKKNPIDIPNSPESTSSSTLPTISKVLTESIENAARQMLQICVWTLLFGTLCAYLPLFLRNEYSLHTGRALLEVTAGTQALAAFGSLPLIAAALAWGGLCVHCQVLSQLRECGQSLPRFWFWRIIHMALAALFCRALLAIFPIPSADLSVSVSAGLSMQMWQFSAPAALGLAAMGLGLIMQSGGRQIKI
ncbi:MAG: hypothetical protein LBJ12_07765 [Oscillospiraceae bacterium]|jgi:hypothetical protein|nr:hypothetical protein [Oscillospiraceae bacterium]